MEPNGKKQRFDILTILVGIGVTIMASGIPWAYSVHGRLSAIEARLEAIQVPPTWFKRQVDDLEERVRHLENNK